MLAWFLFAALAYGSYRLFGANGPLPSSDAVVVSEIEGANQTAASRGGRAQGRIRPPAPLGRTLTPRLGARRGIGEDTLALRLPACVAMMGSIHLSENPIDTITIQSIQSSASEQGPTEWPFAARTPVLVLFTDYREAEPLTYWGTAYPGGQVTIAAGKQLGVDGIVALYRFLVDKRDSRAPFAMVLTQMKQ